MYYFLLISLFSFLSSSVSNNDSKSSYLLYASSKTLNVPANPA
uniref:Uncharacterized protein n=1 Tax=Myoviridae sp. ctkfK18 TaxID=2825165 RepID=A0A8S5VH97_9CAUD|nr:MAG TPA: hypothetical protein [Myoviridae sp. ctkfK18]